MSDPDLGKKRIAAAQKESDKFHEMMGYCIAVWADVDDTLFRIFQHCVGAPLQCAIIYYKTPGLEARFSLTDEIVRSVLPKKKPGEHDHAYVKRWDKAIKETRRSFGYASPDRPSSCRCPDECSHCRYVRYKLRSNTNRRSG